MKFNNIPKGKVNDRTGKIDCICGASFLDSDNTGCEYHPGCVKFFLLYPLPSLIYINKKIDSFW